MKEVIEKLLNGYIAAKAGTFAGHPFGTFMRDEFPKAVYATGIVNEEHYLVTGSVGQGNWAMVPWVCIFDRSITTSATKGVYIVYLLSKDGKSLYLTFNQGCTEIRNTHTKKETISIMRAKAAEIVNNIKNLGFLTDERINLGEGVTELGLLYQKGTIFYKEYKQGAVPSEQELQSDLQKMMEIYRSYVSLKNGPHTGKYDSWEIINDTTAIKYCDKSFFEHNGSGVPKAICWFFNADSLESGKSRAINFTWNDVSYAGRVQRETSDNKRVRIFWNSELGKLFEHYADTPDAALKFVRIDDDNYQVSFVGGETKVQHTISQDISSIKTYIASRGFNYEGNLIENFYLSLKSKPFFILAGTSGTGKTRLAKLFAEAIDAKFKLVPVRPDWSDSTDLFGHVNLSGKFVPGAVLDFINEAQSDRERPYFLCLDEMNLARVEYYLSDFLSIIETREKRNGEVTSDPLVSTDRYGTDDDAIKNYGEIRFPENLYVIGTVNMDETTFPFSRKVLDRANTIEFSFVDLMSMPSYQMEKPEQLHLDNTFLKTEYLFLSDCNDTEDFIENVCQELQTINMILQTANAHVGYRVRDEITFYMLNNKNAALMSRDAAMDNEIMQKILPRIQGSSMSIKDMLCALFKHIAGDFDGTQTQSDTTWKKMLGVAEQPGCRYPNAAKKIAFMVRRFDEDGFTSYWL